MKIIVYVDGGVVIGAQTSHKELKDIEVEVFDYDNMKENDLTGKEVAVISDKSMEDNPYTITVS